MLTPEQLSLRKTGIGGSDAAAIVGLSKYASPVDVYFSKTTGSVKPETSAMRRGVLLEPFVKHLFEHTTGWGVKKVSNTQRSHQHSFMLANLDGYIPRERAIAEFKTADYSTKSDWGEAWTDEMPKEYLIQVAHYAQVMELDKVYVGVLFGSERLFKAYINLHQHCSENIDFDDLEADFSIYTYTKTPVLENKLVKREKHFWYEHVQKQILPPLQVAEDFLKAYPIATNKSVHIGEEGLDLLNQFNELKAEETALKEKKQCLKAKILGMFGDASVLVDESDKPLATWKNKSTTRFTGQDFFTKRFPHLCKSFFETHTTRELRTL